METKQKNKQTNKKNYVDIGWLWRLGKREAVFGKEYEEREREREREKKKTKKSKKPRKLIFTMLKMVWNSMTKEREKIFLIRQADVD